MHVRATLSPFEPTRRGSKTRVRKFFFGKGTRVGASACRSGGMHRGISKKVRRSAVGISVFENWNRYYDPFTGRYIQPEPLLLYPGFAPEVARGGHSTPAYGYAFNSPTMNIDPNGLQATPGMAPTSAPGGGAAGFLGLLFNYLNEQTTTHTGVDGSTWTCNSQGCRKTFPATCSDSSSSRWQCTASCNVQAIPGRAPTSFPERVTGTGTGSSEDAACREAKRSATQSAPGGTYARHCQCSCTSR